jgi:ribonuclease P protein component
MTDYAEANFSAEQPPSREDSRVQGADGDQSRASRPEEASGQGAQAPDAVALLSQDLRLPKAARLRNPEEFRRVYGSGRRFDGSLITVFVLPNGLEFHRLGVTASRKVARAAVGRNRAKRLLRETFRLSVGELGGLQVKYDWVINAHRALTEAKLFGPLKEFREIVTRVGKRERLSS